MRKCLLMVVALACSCVPSDKVCEPLEQRECFCSDGVQGFQYCVSTGTWWTLCDCECRPSCGSSMCGDDGCGGSCGECVNQCTQAVDESLCVDGRCQRACCRHTCELIERECGTWHDNCGGILDCGGCPDGQACFKGACYDEDIMCFEDSNCPWGFRCEDWFCKHNGPYPESCRTSEDCPAYSFCGEGCCLPCGEGMQYINCFSPYNACVSDDDCPVGFSCDYGSCWPQNAPDAVIPLLSCPWEARYFFDMSEPIRGLSTVYIVDALNRNYNNCSYTGIGFVDDVICERKSEYIADYYFSLIDIFAYMQNILSELRVEGIAASSQICPPDVVSATERWISMRFVYLNACCDCGRDPESGCNPYEQPDFPDCANIDISIEELEHYYQVLEVEPFTGKIDVEQGDGGMNYTFALDPRRVQIEYTRLVSFLVDKLVQRCTGQDDLDEALVNSVDCQIMQDIADELLGSWSPNIIQVCENMKPGGGPLMRSLMDQIGAGFKFLNFTGWATITTQSDPPNGTHLGYPSFEETGDGYIKGDCTIVLSGDVEGAWYWER